MTETSKHFVSSEDITLKRQEGRYVHPLSGVTMRQDPRGWAIFAPGADGTPVRIDTEWHFDIALRRTRAYAAERVNRSPYLIARHIVSTLKIGQIGVLETGMPSNGTARVLGRKQTIDALKRRGLVGYDNRLTQLGRNVYAAR